MGLSVQTGRSSGPKEFKPANRPDFQFFQTEKLEVENDLALIRRGNFRLNVGV